MRKECKIMTELSNKMQNPYGDDAGQEAQQQPAGSSADQQGIPPDAYQQGLPPIQGGYQQEPPPAEGGYQQYTPPGSYQQYGYQQYSQGQQQYGYQQQYSASHMGDVGPYESTSLGMRARTAGWLCYLFGWVTGLIFFLLERGNRFVRFHAMQSMLFFGILSILEWVFSHLPFFFGPIGGVLGLVMFVGWIVMIVKAHRGEYYKLPFFGDLAERLIGQIKV
jgi:uncharacterized membrane protein